MRKSSNFSVIAVSLQILVLLSACGKEEEVVELPGIEEPPVRIQVLDVESAEQTERDPAEEKIPAEGTGAESSVSGAEAVVSENTVSGDAVSETDAEENGEEQGALTSADGEIQKTEVYVTDAMPYASFSKVHSSPAILYRNPDPVRGSYVVCVNAGHGSREAAQVKTQCHPDGTPKVTGGSTAAGATMAIAASSGMAFPDGTSEGAVTLRQAMILKEHLLAAGYSVLMIRETEDVSLDNIARTILANEYADCHIAIHWDSSESDKGAFYCSVPSNNGYRDMEPVASTWKKSHAFGDSIIEGLRQEGVKIYGQGAVALDLTQTSYSSVASIDLEMGDKKSDISNSMLNKNAEGILVGLDRYFEIP